MAGKVVLIIGILGIILGAVVAAICLILVATQGGRVAFDEVLPVILGSGCCSSLALVVAVVGVILVLKDKKKPNSPDTTLPPTPPTP